MGNPVKEQYLSAKPTLGTFLNLGSAAAAECAGIAGFDYLIVDIEHSPFGLAEVTGIIRAAELTGIAPFVRIPHISRGGVLKFLDAGARGLIVPGIKTPGEVEQLVEFGKYPPLGNRGFCPTRVCRYGFNGALADGIGAYMEKANDGVMLIPQCETVECLERIEDILGLAGVDGIFIGPFDLSISLGVPGQFDNPAMEAAVDRVLAAAKAAGKPAFIFAPTPEAARLRFDQGFASVTYSADLNMMLETMKAARAAIGR
ncbi:MAG: hypothetical protein LBC31_09605 [Treponema sp.]|jgi:4-hydroxy-2-oxoheptanedioate aldolase|nr:hypothetical protein [Treponema sp.]